LEHGTIHFLRQQYGKKHKLGGRALDNGFRIYGVKQTEDIKKSFGILQEHLDKGASGIVLLRFCGSHVPILQGASLIVLTLSFSLMMFMDLGISSRLVILLMNLISYLLLRYPVGKYFQKRLTMSFDFSGAQITAIEKVKKDNIFERNPVYLVKTIITH
jgi:hypothetical protein